MDLMHVVIVLIVIGVLLALVNYIPMDGKIKKIINIVVVIAVVLWLLSIVGAFHYLRGIHI